MTIHHIRHTADLNAIDPNLRIVSVCPIDPESQMRKSGFRYVVVTEPTAKSAKIDPNNPFRSTMHGEFTVAMSGLNSHLDRIEELLSAPSRTPNVTTAPTPMVQPDPPTPEQIAEHPNGILWLPTNGGHRPDPSDKDRLEAWVAMETNPLLRDGIVARLITAGYKPEDINMDVVTSAFMVEKSLRHHDAEPHHPWSPPPVHPRREEEDGSLEPPDDDDDPSYHDLYITTPQIPRTRIFDLPYGYEVRCNRVGGWSLVYHFDPHIEPRQVAGEYDASWLVLEYRGTVICDGRRNELDPDDVEESSPWPTADDLPFIVVDRNIAIETTAGMLLLRPASYEPDPPVSDYLTAAVTVPSDPLLPPDITVGVRPTAVDLERAYWHYEINLPAAALARRGLEDVAGGVVISTAKAAPPHVLASAIRDDLIKRLARLDLATDAEVLITEVLPLLRYATPEVESLRDRLAEALPETDTPRYDNDLEF